MGNVRIASTGPRDARLEVSGGGEGIASYLRDASLEVSGGGEGIASYLRDASQRVRHPPIGMGYVR